MLQTRAVQSIPAHQWPKRDAIRAFPRINGPNGTRSEHSCAELLETGPFHSIRAHQSPERERSKPSTRENRLRDSGAIHTVVTLRGCDSFGLSRGASSRNVGRPTHSLGKGRVGRRGPNVAGPTLQIITSSRSPPWGSWGRCQWTLNVSFPQYQITWLDVRPTSEQDASECVKVARQVPTPFGTVAHASEVALPGNS